MNEDAHLESQYEDRTLVNEEDFDEDEGPALCQNIVANQTRYCDSEAVPGEDYCVECLESGVITSGVPRG